MKAMNRHPDKSRSKNKGNARMGAEKEDVSVGFVITKRGEVTLKLDLRSRWTYAIIMIIAGLVGSPTLMAAVTKLLPGG